MMTVFAFTASSLKKRPLYPWLFALYPTSFLYLHNFDEVSINVILLPLALSLALASLVWLAALAAARQGWKASLITLLFCVMFFTYGHIRLLLKFPLRRVYLWAGVFLLIAALILLIRRDLSSWIPGLNVFAAFLIVSIWAQIAWARTHTNGSAPEFTQTSEDARLSAAKPDPQNAPDIYYLIIDRYANGKILKEKFDFDNREFLDFLRAKGFYVADDSRCNYPKTQMSLASSLNMDYIDRAQGDRAVGPSFVFQIIKNSRVLRVLKSLGYTSIQLGSWYEPTAFNPFADLNLVGSGIRRYWNDFIIKFVNTTALQPFCERRFLRSRQRFRSLQQLAELERIPSRKGPKFIFAHLLITHPPYVFRPQDRAPDDRSQKKRNIYVDQVLYVNARLSRLIDILISQSSPQPIIIIQSDEGPMGVGRTPAQKRMRKLLGSKWIEGTEEKKNHYPILNAMSFPGVDTTVLYPSISPVNTFRVLFNLYFHARYILLPDRTYDATGEWHSAIPSEGTSEANPSPTLSSPSLPRAEPTLRDPGGIEKTEGFTK